MRSKKSVVEEILTSSDHNEISSIFSSCFVKCWERYYNNSDVDVVVSSVGVGVFRLSKKDGQIVRQMIPIDKLPLGLMSDVYKDFHAKLHEYKKRQEYERFLERQGTLVECSVVSQSKGGLVVSINNSSAVGILNKIPTNEARTLQGNFYALLYKVEFNLNGFQLEFDRLSKDFVLEVMKLSISEIGSTVIVRSIARVPGFESNVLVQGIGSHSVIGACIGFKGARIKKIVKDIGENVKFFEWSGNFYDFVRGVFFKGSLRNVLLEKNNCYLIADQSEVSKVIGKNGLRIRLLKDMLENFWIDQNFEMYVENDEGYNSSDCLIRCRDINFVVCGEDDYKELSLDNLSNIAEQISSEHQEEILNLLFSTRGKNIVEKIENIVMYNKSIRLDLMDILENYFYDKVMPKLREKYVKCGGDSDFFMKNTKIPSAVYFDLLKIGIASHSDCLNFTVDELSTRTKLPYNLCTELMDY